MAQLQLHLPDQHLPVKFMTTCVRRLGKVTPAFPLDDKETSSWQVDTLADPQFGIPKIIELLVGADLLPEIMKSESIQNGGLIAQNTAVGWTISGRGCKRRSATENGCFTMLSDSLTPPWYNQLTELLQRFWKMEDIPSVERKSAAHETCEKIFAEHQRTDDGKYVVRLSLVAGGPEHALGISEISARASLASLHRRTKRDSQFAVEYRKFMEEYITLGHMRLVPEQQLQPTASPMYYIPHHGIWQQSDNGAKLRVVFNASRPTISGHSLNDILYPGPKHQRDIWLVLLRWRSYKIAFCADIRMMFWQNWIDERDVDLQRILWSPSEDEPILPYQLMTVTYGTTCAPYLSLRVLQQLCEDKSDELPEAAEAASKDRYVDDILSGAHEVDDALQLRNQLIRLMESGGFPLRKWVANRPELLQDLDASHCLRSTWIKFTADNPVRELGIIWHPQEDSLGVGCPSLQVTEQSKRNILSALASIFDPCGWLAPATLIIKLLLQDLWRAQLEWDEKLHASMSKRWKAICEDAPAFANLSIPRWIFMRPAPNETRIHAFADASRRAMAAVIFSQTPLAASPSTVALLVAKTKLAPIRSLRPACKPLPRITIPRLELRAALMAAQLLHRTCDELNIPFDNCFAWSDSQIVLPWIHSTEPTGNSLVDNYVYQVQELTPSKICRYVPSEPNPADIACRGATASQLLQEGWWIHGPEWLAAAPSQWPTERQVEGALACNEPSRVVLVALANRKDVNFRAAHLSFFSDLGHLLRFLIRIRRWARHRPSYLPTLHVLDPFTPAELGTAFEACVHVSQRATFGDEITFLKRRKIEEKQKKKLTPFPFKGPLRALDPFLCPFGILRVGGRLEHSALPFNKKHPPIIDGSSELAALIISWAYS